MGFRTYLLLRGSQRVHFSSSKRWLWRQTVVPIRKNPPEIDSLLQFACCDFTKQFKATFSISVSVGYLFFFQSMSNCCRREYVWRFFSFNFWRDFTVWPNSGANQWRLAPNIIGSPCYATDKNGHTRLSSLKFLITVRPVLFFLRIFPPPIWLYKDQYVLLISKKNATATVFYVINISKKSTTLYIY